MQASSRVAMNTGVLYLRMLITVGISLYATRIVLNALGETDFGIFNLIAGVIALLSFLNTAMSTSTQRYLSYYQGMKDRLMQKKIFLNSFFLHLLIGFFLVLLLEGMSFILFDNILNIPAHRVSAAIKVYHFMAATVFFSVISVPFVASLTAHENMFWVAFVNIVETLSRLGIALLLLNIKHDRLEVFGALTALITVLSFIMYAIYCLKKYQECSLKDLEKPNSKIMRELGAYAGWNLFGTLCFLGRTQGLAILLNFFLGSIVNAAYAIANQVTAQMNFFSSTMLRALNPQIMKSEGSGDRERMLKLSIMASKFGFLLLAMVAIPAIFEMHSILLFWLKTVPANTVVFCQLVLVATLINQLTIGLQSAIQATGDIKLYQGLVGTLILVNLPIAYILLKWGFSAKYTLYSYCIIEALACTLRLYFAKKLAGLSIRKYFQQTILKIIFPIISAGLISFLFVTLGSGVAYRFIFTIAITMVIFCTLVYFFSLEHSEKKLVRSFSNKILAYIKK